MITLWGHFQSTIFQNAQWCQSGISLFLHQEMSESQKQLKHCNYTRLQGALLCQLDYVGILAFQCQDRRTLSPNLLQKLIFRSGILYYHCWSTLEVLSLHTLFVKHLDHILVNFEQNRMGQTIQNFELFDTKWLTILATATRIKLCAFFETSRCGLHYNI